ncbi:MAG: hypothetical protein MUP47_07995 [Phycisphaerae bacterium]|nr:hypothetical protein [Phycisphaerae bacterium]
MALQFFRRRQKMVIFIMVILMVSFLIGGYGLSGSFRKDQGGQTLGVSKFGKVTLADLVAASNDLNLLGVLNQAVRDLDYGAVIANRENAALAYALLQKEAKRSPVVVTEESVDMYLQLRGLDGARLDSLLDELRTRMPGLNQRRLRETEGRWIRVATLFYRSSFAVGCPARYGAAGSEQQMRHLYRDLMERIDLRVAVVKAADYLRDAPEPNAQEIQAHFETYRTEPPGRTGEQNPFGFGYVQPDQARVRYLLIRQDVVQRVARPSEEEVRAHYIRHRDRYVKAVPASDPSAARSSAPAGEPMTFSEAKALIVEELSGAAVRTVMDELVAQVTALMDQYATADRGTIGDAYAYALWRITAPAEPVLARELSDLNLRAVPLESAVAALAEKAGLAAIAFPWGRLGQRVLEPNVKVTLKAARMSLGEALESICAQVKWPKLSWAMLRPIPGVLFSVGDGEGVDFFPVLVRDTEPMDLEQMSADEVLGYSRTSADEPLIQIVFTSQAFRPGARGSTMKLGDDGPRMVVTGPRPGRLLWRLVGAEPAHAPQRLDDVPGLAKQVAQDLRTRAAYERALEEARRLQERASKVGLAAAAKRAGLKALETGLFARKMEVHLLREYEAMARMTGRGVSLAELALQAPVIYPLARVEGLELGTEEQRQLFVDAAFALVPQNIEPPFPTSPPATGLVPLPFLREVLVMERIGYEPPVASEYERTKRILAAQLETTSLWRSRMVWFAIPNIAQRVQFAPQQAPQAAATP